MSKCDFMQLYWNRTSTWVFFCKFAAYFQNTFSYEHLWTAASEGYSEPCQKSNILPLHSSVFFSIKKECKREIVFIFWSFWRTCNNLTSLTRQQIRQYFMNFLSSNLVGRRWLIEIEKLNDHKSLNICQWQFIVGCNDYWDHYSYL